MKVQHNEMINIPNQNINNQIFSNNLMRKKNTMLKRIKQMMAAVSLSTLVATTAYAAPISGKVFLDYDNSASSQNAPLSGISVEVLTSAGESLSTPVTATTTADGSYSLDSDLIKTANSYQIKASTANDESITISVIIPSSSGISGQNLFLKGSGGDIAIKTESTVPTTVLLKDIPVFFSASNMPSFSQVSDSSGYVYLKNSLKSETYTIKVDSDDILANTSNGGKSYALWSVTQNSTEILADNFSLAMNGSNQSGSINIRERNEWGADGIIAVDQDGNGVYGYGIDTGAQGFEVALYYRGTTTQVVGTKTLISDDNGEYRFEQLPLGDYTVKILNVKSPWSLISGMAVDQNIAVITSEGQPHAFNYLLKASGGAGALPGVTGFVFLLNEDQRVAAGPDSGSIYNNVPATGSTRFSIPVSLYRHNGTEWIKISTLTSKADGSYSFIGLAKNKDYKIKIDDSSISSTAYTFIGDTDGKSTTRSVALSSGNSETIRGKEIVLVNLASTVSNQNFWYGKIKDVNFNIQTRMTTFAGKYGWGADYYGVPSHSMSAYFTYSVYEEDGVTPAKNTDGTLIGPFSYRSETLPFGTNTWGILKTDHAGVYLLKVDTSAPSVNITPAQQLVNLNSESEPGRNGSKVFNADAINPNIIEGYVYYDKNGNKSLDPEDVPAYSARIQLWKRNPAGTVGNFNGKDYNQVSIMGTNGNGYYNFTDLPDGDYCIFIDQATEFSSSSNLNNTDYEIVSDRVICVTVNGGETSSNNNYIYDTTAKQNVISGTVYLDTFQRVNSDGSQIEGVLQIGASDNNNDNPFFGATILLCETASDSDCYVGSSSVIASVITDVTGTFKFRSSDISTGIKAKTDYIVKVVKEGATALTSISLYPHLSIKPSYLVQFDTNSSAPVLLRFLMKGDAGGVFSGYTLNDLNGNTQAVLSKYSSAVGRIQFYYYDELTKQYTYWFTGGHYWDDFNIRSLPVGKYRAVHIKANNFYTVSDSDPNSDVGTVNFEVMSDGSLADGKGNTLRNFYFAQNYNIKEGVSGQIYLDISGKGVKDSSSILMPASEFSGSGIQVEGYYSPRFYTGYSSGENSVLTSPNFIDSGLETTNYFAHTAANSLLPNDGKLYVTNYLLHLKNLPAKYKIVANSSQTKGDYFSSSIKDDLSYMQVTPTTVGAPNQYYLLQMVTPTTITGHLYYDVNNNNIFDPADEPISGVRVNIYRAGESQVLSYTTSDANGQYQFSNLFDGSYDIEVTSEGLNATKYELVSSTKAKNITIDSTNTAITDIDYLYNKIGDASISGYVMLDINNNGQIDIDYNKQGDFALSGITIELYSGSLSSTPKTALTNAKGYYNFPKLNLETDYYVKVVTSGTAYGVIANSNQVGSQTSDTLDKITIGTTASSVTNQSFLFAGNSNSDPSGGVGSSTAKNSGISGFAYESGTTTAIDSSVMISLYDNSNNEIARQKTDSTGNYHFYNLPNGTYSVKVTTAAAGLVLSSNAAGTSPFDTISSLTLSGIGINGQNFYYKKSSEKGIQGDVYVDFGNDNTTMTLDANDHPLSGAEVELYEGLNGTGSVLRTTTSTSDGHYEFPDLLYGLDYSVKIKMSSINDYDFKRSVSGSDSTAVIINVAALDPAGSLYNNYLVIGKQSISGDVWIDVDGDLSKGPSDELINDVGISLNYKAPGATDYTNLKTMKTKTLSSLNGQYVFSNLPKGTDYQVVIDGKSSVLDGTILIASTGVNSISGNTDTFNLTNLAGDITGQSTAYRYKGEISGELFIDIDGDMAKGPVDSTFADVDLILSATINGKKVTKTATTDSDGKFNFDNLPIGSWSLSAAESQSLANWSSYTLVSSKDSNGNVKTGTSSLPLTIAITSENSEFEGIEIGYQGTAKISGYVVLDPKPSDTHIHKEAGDIAVEKIKVTLSGSATGFKARDIYTDSNGYYEFNGLAKYTYRIGVDNTHTDLTGYVISFDGLGQKDAKAENTVEIALAEMNSTVTDADFGYKADSVITGVIVKDLGGEGKVHSTVDSLLAGVVVKAVQGDIVRYSNVTEKEGKYRIENLINGKWVVTLETLPASDYSFSYVTNVVGNTATAITDGVEIDIDPKIKTFAVSEANVDFGVKAKGSVAGKVVIDVDDMQPMPATVDSADIAVTEIDANYTVNLYVGSTLVATTKPNSDGEYTFSNLADNQTYRIEVNAPTNYISSFNVVGTLNNAKAGADSTTTTLMTREYSFTTTDGQVSDSHFGWKGSSSIAGEVFLDKDDNGLFDSSIDDNLGAELTLVLTHASGQFPTIQRKIASDKTSYQVSGLVPGQWTIKVENVPTQFKASFDPDDAHSKSKMPVTPGEAVVKIMSGSLLGQNFGYIEGGSISGVVKEDANESGSVNPSHLGISGVTVSLLTVDGTKVTDLNGKAITATTNRKGEFNFRNLDVANDYKVQLVFGSHTSSSDPLFEMEPSYDSETVGAITSSSKTVDYSAETHTLLAKVSTAKNHDVTESELYFGYRALGGDLTIHKKALKDNVVAGDIVPYTITIENNKAATAFNVTIKDLIPAGFKYVAGSARLDGKKIEDPAGGRPLFFGPMDIGGQGNTGKLPSKRTLTYLLVVGAGVTQGEYKNIAVALQRSGKDASNTSTATVTVTSDPLFDNALIFGKVYVDKNGNGVQDEGEEGLSGVKLVTVRGEIITTDAFGRYHLAGVNGGRWERGTNFVLKLDTKSLPKGYKVVGRNPIVVRLSPGLPSKVDFKVIKE